MGIFFPWTEEVRPADFKREKFARFSQEIASSLSTTSEAKKNCFWTLKRTERLVDADLVISALLGGAAREVFRCPQIEEFAMALHTLREVGSSTPRLAARPKAVQRGVTEAMLSTARGSLPLTVYPGRSYRATLEEAQRGLGERAPKDVDVRALVPKIGARLGSNDEDFASAGVPRFTRAVLLQRVKH